jgi:4-amino-4-deoxy-L-arabinose transferase-like glycosyltransferase
VRLPRAFLPRLALIALVGLAVRLLYVALFAKDIPTFGDALTYWHWSHNLAGGNGFTKVAIFGQVDPLVGQPTAEHPPLFPLLLAGLVKLGADGITTQKLLLCFVGAGTVGLVGLAGREALSERTGLIACAIAAVYPFLWVIDGSLMSETVYAFLIAAALWLGLRFTRTPSLGLAAALGAVAGLAALTRGEALMLAPLLLLPLALRAPRDWDRRTGLAAAALATFAVVLAPWTIRNMTTFDEPVLISTNSSSVFAGANCDRVYHGRFTGLWALSCFGGPVSGDESEGAAEYRSRGFDYARDHIGRVPVVMAVRFLRVWDLYRPLQQAKYEFFEGRSRWASRAGLVFLYPLLVLAVVGAVVLRRRGRPLWPLLAFVVMVSLTAVLIYGVTRFRVAAEPSLIVLGAVGLEAVAGRLSVAAAEGRRTAAAA